MEKWLVSSGLRYPFFSFPVLCLPILFHCRRHTHATMMLTLGVDLYTVSKLLGHTNIQTTQIYAKLVDESKKKAIDLIPNIS
ncbi:tyrosine-type recombinase/integrase [Phocaeicola sp.]|uniref:tyrosine-type recombinase/integrase n=1 Tax=Phocaeicola sp. TaxID=2773926 RepID=UPI003A908F91